MENKSTRSLFLALSILAFSSVRASGGAVEANDVQETAVVCAARTPVLRAKWRNASNDFLVQQLTRLLENYDESDSNLIEKVGALRNTLSTRMVTWDESNLSEEGLQESLRVLKAVVQQIDFSKAKKSWTVFKNKLAKIQLSEAEPAECARSTDGHSDEVLCSEYECETDEEQNSSDNGALSNESAGSVDQADHDSNAQLSDDGTSSGDASEGVEFSEVLQQAEDLDPVPVMNEDTTVRSVEDDVKKPLSRSYLKPAALIVGVGIGAWIVKRYYFDAQRNDALPITTVA